MLANIKAAFADLSKDTGGQANVLMGAVTAVGGLIGILVYASVYAGMNKDTISAGTQSLLTLIPIVLAAVMIIGILGAVLALR